jgi:hypothetical protein
MTSSRTWPVSGRLPGSAIPSLLSVTPATGLRQGQAEGPICSAAGPRSRRPRTPPPPLSNQLSFVASVGVDDAFANLDELTRLNGLKLVPGMPVEAFIRTDERTMLSYLFNPLSDQARRAFREK